MVVMSVDATVGMKVKRLLFCYARNISLSDQQDTAFLFSITCAYSWYGRKV